jgi:folate-binding protein YgfZ
MNRIDLTTNLHETELAYHVALSSIGVAESRAGAVEVTGKDALDFLHRMSTNDLLSLETGQYRTTVLINDRAKIIDLVRILKRKDSVLILTSEGNSSNVMQWLEKFIIMEDVQLTDITSTVSICSLIGPKAYSLIQEHISVNIPTITASDGFDQNNVIMFRNDIGIQPVYTIISTNDVIANFLQTTDKMSVRLPQHIQILSNDVWNTLRIEEGVPSFGLELTDQVNPLEAGLEKFISFTKGCYIGQEVIARIDTYKKLQKKLTGLTFDGSDAELSLEPGKLLLEGSEIGLTTSHCWSFKLKKIIALGYMKTNVAVNEADFQSNLSSKSIKTTISSLPFTTK